MPSLFRTLRFVTVALPCWILATVASRASINKVSFSGNCVYKSRKWHAEFSRVPGNFFVRLRNAPVQVLSKAKWYKREQELSGADIIDGQLRLAKLDGIPLSELLNKTDCPTAKAKACEAAIRSLFEFHQRFKQSHGDASATNVMIVEQANGDFSATWFDFDVAHTGESTLENCADDLRALLHTSKHICLTDRDQQSKECYPDEDVWAQLSDCHQRDLLTSDVFHLAQILRARVQR